MYFLLVCPTQKSRWSVIRWTEKGSEVLGSTFSDEKAAKIAAGILDSKNTNNRNYEGSFITNILLSEDHLNYRCLTYSVTQKGPKKFDVRQIDSKDVSNLDQGLAFVPNFLLFNCSV